MSTETVKELRRWLQQEYADYEVSDDPVEGTYGLVWFLKETDHGNHEFAVKTMDPEHLSIPDSDRNIEYLKREFAIWRSLPPCHNVVRAFGFDFANYYSIALDKPVVALPVMKMPKCDGSLEDWIQDASFPSFPFENRLLAVAQSLTGLIHLYKNGIEGHGDLKPSNILYENWSKKHDFPERESWPSAKYPWLIRIADFGWSDIWRDYGLTNKALREYMAPERLGGKFIPKSSDMFAMGVIAFELITGKHPARNLKKAKKSQDSWRRCIEQADWNLDLLQPGRIRSVISAALSVDSTNRPSPEEFLQEVCAELESNCGIGSVALTLKFYRDQNTELLDVSHLAQAAIDAARLGSVQRDYYLDKLERYLSSISVNDLNDCEKWSKLARATIYVLERQGGAEAVDKIDSLRAEANGVFSSIVGGVNSDSLEVLSTHEDVTGNFRAYEKLSEIIGEMAFVANVNYESEKEKPRGLGPLALSALAFSEACQNRGDKDRLEYLLSESIRHSPEQPEPYYFRAFWTEQILMMLRARELLDSRTAEELIERSLVDLEHARRLAPTWGRVEV